MTAFYPVDYLYILMCSAVSHSGMRAYKNKWKGFVTDILLCVDISLCTKIKDTALDVMLKLTGMCLSAKMVLGNQICE